MRETNERDANERDGFPMQAAECRIAACPEVKTEILVYGRA
jgi:hypothetical protein